MSTHEGLKTFLYFTSLKLLQQQTAPSLTKCNIYKRKHSNKRKFQLKSYLKHFFLKCSCHLKIPWLLHFSVLVSDTLYTLKQPYFSCFWYSNISNNIYNNTTYHHSFYCSHGANTTLDETHNNKHAGYLHYMSKSHSYPNSFQQAWRFVWVLHYQISVQLPRCLSYVANYTITNFVRHGIKAD
jgi:hypothetical protein